MDSFFIKVPIFRWHLALDLILLLVKQVLYAHFFFLGLSHKKTQEIKNISNARLKQVYMLSYLFLTIIELIFSSHWICVKSLKRVSSGTPFTFFNTCDSFCFNGLFALSKTCVWKNCYWLLLLARVQRR